MFEKLVKESELSLPKIIESVRDSTRDATLAGIIGAKIIIEDNIAKLKTFLEEIDKEILSRDFLVEKERLFGKTPEGCDAKAPYKIMVAKKDGSIIPTTISAKIDTNFTVSPKIREVVHLVGVVPDKYKHTEIRLNKKVMETDFENGTMPSTVALYCMSKPTEIISVKKSVEKPGKKSE